MILTIRISVQCLVTSFFKQSNENSPSSRDVYNFKQITMFLFLQNRSGFSVLFFAKIVFLHNISIFAESVWFPYFCFCRNCFSCIMFCSCKIGSVSPVYRVLMYCFSYLFNKISIFHLKKKKKKKKSFETYPTLSPLKHKTKTYQSKHSQQISINTISPYQIEFDKIMKSEI